MKNNCLKNSSKVTKEEIIFHFNRLVIALAKDPVSLWSTLDRIAPPRTEADIRLGRGYEGDYSNSPGGGPTQTPASGATLAVAGASGLSTLGENVEGNNIHGDLDFAKPIWETKHREIIQTNLPVFLCPSSSGESQPFTVVDGDENPYSPDSVKPVVLGRSHYVASHGQESAWGPEAGSALSGQVFTDIYTFTTATADIHGDVSRVADGPFYRNSKTQISEVSDGTTTSIFLGEHSSRLSDKTWVGVVPGATVHPRFSSPENGPDGAATLVLYHMGPSGGELDITGFPIIHPVNFPTYHVGQMYSEHPSGGNVCMGDGSVQFISESVDLITWAELSSINEGEVIGEWQ